MISAKRWLSVVVCLIMALAFTGCAKDEKQVLTVYNWGDYIDESVLADFEKETGVKVNYELFATNEDMYVKIKQGGTAYDIAFPSDYMIEKMIDEDMLQPLDKSKLSNLGNIDPRFMDLEFDKGNKYSVPYFWGTVGILYNKDMVKETVDSWNILWDPKYKGQVMMLDSQRDSLAVALKKLGYSLNTRDIKELEAAKQELLNQKPIVLAYAGDNIKDMMATGEGAMAVVWSGDAVYLMGQYDFLDFALPKEGSNIWFDNVVIPKNAQNVEAAHQFIDFLSRPDIAKRNTEYVGFSTPNKEALKLVSEDLKGNEAYYPTEEALKDFEIFVNPGEFIEEYNRVWTEFKAE